jgi:Family of unknown function (DUF5681)
MADRSDEAVGYGRPPKATQFRAGQSGNPSGRPKGIRNFLTDLRAELNSTTTINERGRQVTVTKQLAIVKSLIAAAIGGDMRAVTALVTISMRMAAEDHDEARFSAEDAEVIEDFENRKREAEHGLPNPQLPRNSDDN